MKNLKSKKLYFQVFEELKTYIIKNNLKPGDKLPTEQQMCEVLGVSRNVLREAIKTLEIIGVLSSKPGVGIMINSFNSNFLSTCMFLNLVDGSVNLRKQSQNVRKALEIYFAQEIIDNINDEQIKTLEQLIERMKNENDKPEFLQIDCDFHHTLYKECNNLVLTAILDSTWEIEKAYYDEAIVEEPELRYIKHKAIFDAIVSRNYDNLITAIKFHFSYDFKPYLK